MYQKEECTFNKDYTLCNICYIYCYLSHCHSSYSVFIVVNDVVSLPHQVLTALSHSLFVIFHSFTWHWQTYTINFKTNICFNAELWGLVIFSWYWGATWTCVSQLSYLPDPHVDSLTTLPGCAVCSLHSPSAAGFSAGIRESQWLRIAPFARRVRGASF